MPPLFTMLTIKNLTKSHAGRTLFRETEMTINWGERVALVGPNGAGKSTLFRMILGEDTPDEGSINMDEYAMVGYLPQEASEPKDETVLEIAMGITPEMERAIHVIRTAENVFGCKMLSSSIGFSSCQSAEKSGWPRTISGVMPVSAILNGSKCVCGSTSV